MRTRPDLPTSNHNAIWEALFSTYFFPTLLVADEIGLFTLLHQSPRTVDDVAQAYELSPRSKTKFCHSTTRLLPLREYVVPRGRR
jgi:hypothetical protein